MNLGETIYRLRTGRGMSQDALAGALDVSRQSVSKWENNAAVPELDKLIKLSEVFGVTLDELVGRDAPAPTPPAAPPAQSPPPYRTIGAILLGFGLLTTLLLSILGGFALGVIVGLPFTIAGSICIASTEGILFKSAWAFFSIYAPLLSYFALNFMGFGWGIRIGILVIWFVVLVMITLRLNRKGKLSKDSKKLMIGCVIIAFVLFASLEIANSIRYHSYDRQTATEPLDVSCIQEK